MDRRIFLKSGAAIPLAAALPRAFAQQTSFNPRPGSWRTYEITTRVEVLKPAGETRVWLPVPSVEGGWQKPLDNSWAGNAKVMRVAGDGKYGTGIFVAEWPAGEAKPVVALTNSFMTRDRAIDLSSRPDPALRLDAAEAKFYTAPTELVPTDGIVRKTALEITRGTRTDAQKAKAIYDWIVDNTFRDPKTRGCGVGDIKAMLESGNLGGKCADLNALYVGLARSVGLPARDLYGLRVAKSQFGYRSLGAGTENVTRAQHCRAEVFLTGYGWVPVDPADVRKVVLEERDKPTTLADPLVPAVRQKLFGAWEMNWLAFNTAHDVALPGSKGARVGFFMYPQLETSAGRADSLDPDNFKYTITARTLAS
ncbi:MAG TPA: transglutaminase domain-containing protein [Burkholderiales bacterium]|nr:transglutaminase domain-containing protein [Burkholderiales bacterium]